MWKTSNELSIALFQKTFSPQTIRLGQLSFVTFMFKYHGRQSRGREMALESLQLTPARGKAHPCPSSNERMGNLPELKGF
jgi:hypothetical protein